MKLEIKHLAPYLPFQPNVLHLERNIALKATGIYKKYNADEHFDILLLNWDLTLKSTEVKPILRPLSDLIKEIECDGIKCIPAIEIAKRVDNGHSYDSISRVYSRLVSIITDKCDDIENVNINLSHDGSIYSIRRGGENVMFKTYQAIESLLLSMHFDIFGLIDQDLAIDINTLDK